MALISHSTCANANADAECNSKHSTDAPGIVCSFCYLVQVRKTSHFRTTSDLPPKYCSRDCQLKDSSRHGLECKSPLSKPGWKPSWEFDRRTPAFVGDGEIQEAHGVQKFLWGNIPALDVCRLQHNEGLEKLGDLRLLFAGRNPSLILLSSLRLLFQLRAI